MVTYIYFVKCPNCEDEHFDFFDDAKEYALGCLSQKPIITQTEVNRNDFGECTDHCDLGTVWSWEDMMKDIEPEDMVFSKAETFGISEDIDFEDDPQSELTLETYNKLKRAYDRAVTEYEAANPEDFKEGLRKGPVPTNTYISTYDYDRLTKDELYDYIVNKQNGVDVEIGDQGYSFSDIRFSDGSRYSDSYLTVEFHEGKFIATETYMSDDGDSQEGDVIIETESFDELWDQLMDFKPEGLVEKCNKKDRKPIPEGMSIEELKEAMEENEDTVECVGCEELFPKDECFHKDGIGWVCGNCEDRIVKCSWCDGLYDRGECRKEVDLGWLCDRCEAAIKSRGETLTFREGNYWDFLDESTAVTDSANIGKRVRLIHKDSGYHVDGTEYQLYDLKRLLRVSKIADLSPTSINLIVKFDNSCKIIQETDKGYLLSIPCYFRNQRDRSKIETKPVYVRCWVPKVQVELIEDFREASEDDFFNAFD